MPCGYVRSTVITSGASTSCRFYRWHDAFQSGGPEALADRPSRPSRVRSRLPAEIREQRAATRQMPASPHNVRMNQTSALVDSAHRPRLAPLTRSANRAGRTPAPSSEDPGMSLHTSLQMLIRRDSERPSLRERAAELSGHRACRHFK
ncbi:hypothetical protein CIW48_18440 [Methylobacterium sp. P1-11]|nr:hypothetical protein CIW48_18440 [Methylobacterium sp. P1-11]